jgi:hypothetical protein
LNLAKEKIEFDKKAFIKEKRQKEFASSFKDIDFGHEQIIKIPEILYVANKAENGFEGDLLADFFNMFPHTVTEKDPYGDAIEPIFISAEHGDGLTDLFISLKNRIP